MAAEVRVYVGYDSKEQSAYDTCVQSIRMLSRPVPEVFALHQERLRADGLYTRPQYEPAATEFAFTRFLVPHLNSYQGWALFCDCDFVFTRGLDKLFDLVDDNYAVMVVKHDYTPKAATKMDGHKQIAYPRKNWSSLVLFNCASTACKRLSKEYVNAAPAADLHRFAWCEDARIGALPTTWNWLEGEYEPYEVGYPAGVHYTNGGPWFKHCQDVVYADLWRNVHALSKHARNLISDEYRALNRRLHEDVPSYGTTAGSSAKNILSMARGYEAERVLDYGCGKCILARTIGHRIPVVNYDPALPEHAGLPLPEDFVACLDTLEHVEPDKLADVLGHLRYLMKKAGFFTISLRPSSKTLADGRNAHLIVENKEWWLQQLRAYFEIEGHGKYNHDDTLWVHVRPH
jgi:hypothetical protein